MPMRFATAGSFRAAHIARRCAWLTGGILLDPVPGSVGGAVDVFDVGVGGEGTGEVAVDRLAGRGGEVEGGDRLGGEELDALAIDRRYRTFHGQCREPAGRCQLHDRDTV